jgi:hypothetical protein
MFRNLTSNIKDFPFSDFASLNETEATEHAEKLNVKVFNPWMLTQMVAFFGSLEATYNQEGLIDPKAFMIKNFGTDKWRIGMWKVVHKLRRSALVKSQSTAEYANYSTMVPLIMSGLKKHQDIPYSRWSKENLHLVMEPSLLEAATCVVPSDITTEHILEARETGLTVKGGPNAGKVNNPITTWRLMGIQHTSLQGLPVLTQTMLAQIWVCHPSLRSKYMILDPMDWDNIPDSIIPTDAKMFHSSNDTKTSRTTKKSEVVDVPW